VILARIVDLLDVLGHFGRLVQLLLDDRVAVVVEGGLAILTTLQLLLLVWVVVFVVVHRR